MKVYEMKETEIGEAVETQDAIIVSLRNEHRTIIIMKSHIKPVVGKINVAQVDSEPMKQESEKKRKLKPRKSCHQKRMELEYLPIKTHPKWGKSLNSSVALKVYKRYAVRLWNNIIADVQSRVNSANAPGVSTEWMHETLKGIFDSHGASFNERKYWAVIMFLRENELITIKRLGQRGKVYYNINRHSEIPKTIST